MAFPIPPALGSKEDIKRRFDTAVKRRELWDTHLRECYELAVPQRESFLLRSEGDKRQAEIFDDTAITGVQDYVSRLQSTLIPPWRKFSIFTPGSEIKEGVNEKVQELLDKQSDIFFAELNQSNFAIQTAESIMDLAISTGAFTMELGEGDSLFEFNAVPMAEIYPEEGPNGTIETNFRKRKVKGRNIKRLWPKAELSEELTKQVNDKPDEDIEVVEGVIFVPNSGQYELMIMATDKFEPIYNENLEDSSPWIIFREMVAPGEILGRGRVMSVLPQIKTANLVVEFILRNAALNVSGIYTATDDSAINPYTIQLAPNTIIPVSSNDSRNPTLRALERSGDAQLGQLVLEDIRKSIRKALFADPFGDLTDPVRTAFEMSLRNNELLMSSGASFGRLQTELVAKMMKRGTHILQKAGKMAEMKVDGREVGIKHTSPLSRAQDQEDLLSFQQYTELLAPFGPEITALGTKIEDIPGWLGTKLGIPQKLLRDDAEKKGLQEQVAKIVASQQLAQGAPQ